LSDGLLDKSLHLKHL